MKILLFTRVPESIGRVLVKQEAEKRGHEIDYVDIHTVGVDQTSLAAMADSVKEYDIFHCAAGLGDVVLERLHELLNNSHVFCVNNRTKVASEPGSKLSQALRFGAEDVSTPKTVRSDRPNYAELKNVFGDTLIAKKPYGAKGKEVWLIKNQDDLDKIADSGEWLFQEYIESDGDYRVHVVGMETPFCAYRRMNPPDDFRSNISQGGSAKAITDPEEEVEVNALAVKAARAMRFDYCAVDIIRSKVDGKLYVLEINMDPGFLHVEEITGKSFAKVIVDYYESAAQKQ